MSTTTSLRVLAVEDSADDVELFARALKVGGYATHIERVDRLESLRHAIMAHSWDVILADYTLPGLTGVEAIALIRTCNIATPIIVVSGTIGEDAAVQAMRAGADDYVLKQHMSRLPTIIGRQLTEADDQRTWRAAEFKRRDAEVKSTLAKEQLRNALALLSRGALYIVERLESRPPDDERQAMLQALREAATAGRLAAFERIQDDDDVG